MIIELDYDSEPLDQGVQAVCASMPAAEQWINNNWPTARRYKNSDTWEIFDHDLTKSLDSFLTITEYELEGENHGDTTKSD